MIFLRQSCCGLSLRKGTLIICYWVLTQEIITFIALLMVPDDHASKSIIIRNDSSSARFFRMWAVAFNILVIGTALYGVYKERAPLMIPFLAMRTVNLIFSVFTLMNARAIASALNETIENSRNNERDETFDTLPLVVVAILISMGAEAYFLLIVYSFYQMLIREMAMIAVAVPVISYPTSAHDFNVYAQPAVNPYLFEVKNPYLYQEPYPPPPGFLQHYNGYHPGMANIGPPETSYSQPPPYRP